VSPLDGFPHSVILGSQLVCSSPRLIAAYHDLHRLSMPRHPPCALLRLISNSIYGVLSYAIPHDGHALHPPFGVDSSHPICRLPDRSIIHPSIVKELDRSQPSTPGESSGSVKKK
jgi:hypothetical protein